MNSSYPIRPIALPELPQYLRVLEHAFNSTWPAAEFLEWQRDLFEFERSLAAFDGEEIVGTTDIISFELTVPGGAQVGCAGVTGVAVLPSHRRRGILSALMTRQLADIAAGTEPVAALLPSESVIYGRYGYGAATGRLSYKLKRGEALLPAPARPVSLRLVEPRDATRCMTEIYDAIRPSRPGMLTRSKAYWDSMTADP